MNRQDEAAAPSRELAIGDRLIWKRCLSNYGHVDRVPVEVVRIGPHKVTVRVLVPITTSRRERWPARVGALRLVDAKNLHVATNAYWRELLCRRGGAP
jgi:hypothetical protein